MTRVVTWDEVEADEVYPGIFRQQLTGAQGTVVRYVYRPGSTFPVHQHPEEQITVVHLGEIEFTVAGEAVVLRAGQVAVIPGNVPHGARVRGGDMVVADNFIASADRAPLRVSRQGTGAGA